MERPEVRKYDVFVGVDVGKSSNCVVALPRDADEAALARDVAQEEADIREVLGL